jgi:predicted esterase
MAGKKDKENYESIKDLGKWFSEKKANVTIVEYDDGHTLPEKDLENVLRSVIPK